MEREVCDMKEGRKWFAICRARNEVLMFGREEVDYWALQSVCVEG
jgi:hypothetical protein